MVRFNHTERRLIKQLTLYWQAKRDDRPMPALYDMNERELEVLKPHCFVLKLLPTEHPPYEFKFVGHEIIETVKSHYPYHWELVKRMIEPLDDAIKARQPHITETAFSTGNNRIVKFRQTMLPLSEDGITVDHIFGGMSHMVEEVKGAMPDTLPEQTVEIEHVDQEISSAEIPEEIDYDNLTTAERLALEKTQEVRNAMPDDGSEGF